MATVTEVRESDADGRVTLPRDFASATLLLEQVSDVELVIRKTAPSQPVRRTDAELGVIRLSADEFDAFVAALDHPPAPTDHLRRLMAASPPAAD